MDDPQIRAVKRRWKMDDFKEEQNKLNNKKTKKDTDDIKQELPTLQLSLEERWLPLLRSRPWGSSYSSAERKILLYLDKFESLRHRLQNRIDEYLANSNIDGECFLYHGSRSLKGRTIPFSISFSHKGTAITLTPHIMFIRLHMEGLLTEDHLRGIIFKRWHASHICGIGIA